MHFNLVIPVSLFFTLLSIFGPSFALPFITRRKATSESLAARATYSVVPIDGGGSDSEPTKTTGTTIIETVVVTPSPATKTIIESSPPVTDTITISDTIIVTANPTTLTVPTTISIIDIQPTTNVITKTVTEDDAVSTSSTTSSSSVESTTTTTLSSISSTTPATPPNTIATSTTSSTPTLPQPTTSIDASLTTSSATFLPTSSSSLSSSTSYDNGYWHTTYPPWNGTVTRRFAHES